MPRIISVTKGRVRGSEHLGASPEHLRRISEHLTVPLLRRVRSYRKAGLLVGIREFLHRRTVCSGCERRKVLPTHRGLYGCGKCAACSGGPERMLAGPTICPLGKW